MATKNIFANARTRSDSDNTKAFEPKMEIGRHTMICTDWVFRAEPEVKRNARGEEYIEKPHHLFTFMDVKTKEKDVIKVVHTKAAEQWFLGKVNKRTKGDLALKAGGDYLNLAPEDFGLIAQYLNTTKIELLYDESYFYAPDGSAVKRNPHLQIELPEDKPTVPTKSWHA